MTSTERGEAFAARRSSRDLPEAAGSGAPVAPAVVVHAARSEGAAAAAQEIAARIGQGPGVVLGLATGGTMIEVYSHLVRLIERDALDVSQVTTFNLDEYLGLPPGDSKRFDHFMRHHLFVPGGFDLARCHFPDAVRAESDPAGASRAYEAAIHAAGGIDLQLLGVGRNGHIAFNEPGSLEASRTRVVELDGTTREDATAAFGSERAVPREAITVGVRTILEARAIRVLAFGAAKAQIVRRALQEPISAEVPASFLRRHSEAVFHLDPDAASELRRA